MEEGVEVEKSPSTTPFPSFTLKAGTGGKVGHGWLGSCQLAPTLRSARWMGLEPSDAVPKAFSFSLSLLSSQCLSWHDAALAVSKLRFRQSQSAPMEFFR